MHLLKLEHPVKLKHGPVAAGEWLLNDLNAFEIAAGARPVGGATVEPFKQWPNILFKESGELVYLSDDDNRTGPVLFMRNGAIGDLLFLGVALREFKRTTGKNVALCTWPSNHAMFEGCDFIDELVSYPLAASEAHKYLAIYDLFNVMERDHENHASDAFAKEIGLTLPMPDYKPFYRVTDAEKEAADNNVFTSRPTLVIQPSASSPTRSYPMSQWLEVIVKLERAGWGIVLLGLPGQFPPFPPEHATPFIRDLSRPGLSFRESAAVLSLATAFVGVDSAFLHLCHALDIPAVGLFASIPWQIRTMHAPKTTTLSGHGACAPCFYHAHNGSAFPAGKPCSTAGRCVVLADIEPARIIAKVNLLKP